MNDVSFDFCVCDDKIDNIMFLKMRDDMCDLFVQICVYDIFLFYDDLLGNGDI